MDRSTQHDSEAGRADARPARRVASGAVLSRIVWRWHFWAGLLAGPVLIVCSLTGALYIFKDDLQPLLYPHLMRVAESPSEASLADQVAAARGVVGDGWHAASLSVTSRRGAAHSVEFHDANHQGRRVYVDPGSATVLGELNKPHFFSVVLDIHRRLFAGTFGRALVELTTSWTIVLVASGVFLWWPKSWRKLKGVLIPRLDGKRYIALRDWHAITGALVAPVAIVVAFTGLLYSLAWGTTFLTIGFESGAFDIAVNPPNSAAPDDPATQSTVSIDHVFALAVERGMSRDRMSIGLPETPDDAYSVNSGGAWGPSITGAMFVDQYSGEVIQHAALHELPLMAQWTQWNYPLHVGSVMGMGTKILWLVASLALCAAPCTGVCMWLARRKPHESGAPKRYDAALPVWLWGVILMTGLVLPMAGASLLIVGAASVAVDLIRPRIGDC